MKKIFYTLISLSIVAFAACNKLGNTPEIRLEPAPAPKTFTVNVPGSYETKTTLDGLKPKWVTGDEIRVYGHNTDSDTYTDNAVYELKSGNGEGTAVFALKDGETGLSGTYDEFYAVYPSDLTVTGLPDEITLPRLNGDAIMACHLRGQNPSVGQIDPKLAIMTAKYDGATMSFRHGVSYIKLTIPDDGVTEVDIDFKTNCLADTPTYYASNGALKSVGNSSTHIKSAKDMVFIQGESYYFAAIPRSGYAPTTTKITLTGGETYSTTHFTVLPEVGKVYDLGCPSKVPAFTASNVEIEADDEAGTINFTVSNLVDGGAVTKEVLAGATIDNLSLGAVSFNTSTGVGSVSFTCDENTESDPKTATVRLTYTYNTDQTVTKDVTITQKKVGTVTNTYWLYYGESTTLTNTSDYFTLYNVDLSSEFSASYGGATSFNVESTDCTYGLYLDAGSDYIEFTVTTGFTAAVTYYYIATVSGDAKGTRTKLTDGSTTQTTSNIADLWGNYASDSKSGLVAGSKWKIQRDNKKPAILLVKVVETSN